MIILIYNIHMPKHSENCMKIQDELRQPLWSNLVMQAVLASKSEKREKKGRCLFAYSLDLSNPATKKENLTTFAEAFCGVKELGKSKRFQLVVKTTAVHWTTLDVILTPDKGVKMLNIDAVNDSSAIVVCSSLFETYKKNFSSDAQSTSSLFFLKHDKIPGTDKARQIQYDKIGCSRFALDIFRTYAKPIKTEGLLSS